MFQRDLYLTNDPNLNFLQEIKNYIDEKDDDFVIYFFDVFDEAKYLSYVNEAMNTLDYIVDIENENSYHFFDYWINAALTLFIRSLWETSYKNSQGDENEKTKAAKSEIMKFKNFMEEFNFLDDLENNNFSTLN